jgi:uncharacterized phage-like protein YoqJ
MIIAFIGHSYVPFGNDVKESVKEQIRKNTPEAEKLTCYVGGYGDFDRICANACRELKEELSDIEIVYVTPYISLSEQKKINEMQKMKICDASIYPPIESVPKRYAIVKRNQWMVTNADLVIAYVNRSWGGAYKSLQVAKSKGKRVISICDS